MRTTRILIALLATGCFAGSAGLTACSAEGGGDLPDASVEQDAAGTPDAAEPEDTGSTPQRDAGPGDAGGDARDAGGDARDAGGDARDAASDARDASDGATTPDAADASYDPTGAACAPANTVQERVCGRCGKEKRLCWPQDGGAAWLDWGPCQGEKADAGFPNTQESTPCEMCGTKTITWDSQCNASVGFCAPAPGAQCEKGAGEWAPGLSCTVPLGRYRTCNNQCLWEPFSDCTAYVNPNKLTIAAGADAGANIATATFQYTGNPRMKRLVGSSDLTCPITSTSYPSSDLVVFAYVEVKNPTNKAAVVSLWHGTGDTQMAVYAGSAPPEQDAERRACITGTKATDSCPSTMTAQCGGSSQFSTAGVASVPIPAGGTITVWNAPFSTSAGPGPFTLSVRTDSLQ